MPQSDNAVSCRHAALPRRGPDAALARPSGFYSLSHVKSRLKQQQSR